MKTLKRFTRKVALRFLAQRTPDRITMGILDKSRKAIDVQPTVSAPESPDVVDSSEPWWVEPGAASADRAPIEAPLLPSAAPSPCPKCGGCFWWETFRRVLHCCECVRVPSRPMLVELWRVTTPTGDAGGPFGWARWEPGSHWNPFGHLDAEREKVEAKEAAEEDF